MAVGNVTGVSLGQDQFLQLLVAQLQNQDPLDPVSDREFIAQLASFSTLQGIQSLNTSFAQMLKLQQLTQGVELIGRTVDYAPAGGGAAQSGRVDSVAVDNGQIVLTVGSTQVPLDRVQSLRA